MPDAKMTDNAEPTTEQEPAIDAPTSAQEPDHFVVLQNLQRENAEMKDRLLRTFAEMENLRRRTEKEVADAKLYGVSAFARDMLSFADNLHRAVENIPPQLRDSGDQSVKTLIEGIELTERDFLGRLARDGVKKLDPLGNKFDPNLHEALFELPDESVPNGTVLKVVEEGYTIGDRVLRPAKVGISRGAPRNAG